MLSPSISFPAVAFTPQAARSGSSRVKEVVRVIRRELLGLEESIPWNCVTPAWKNTRPAWRRGLQRSTDSPAPTPAPAGAGAGGAAGGGGAAAVPPPESPGDAASAAAAAALSALVGATATAMLELHESLMTDKGQGLFARRGAWETRLKELADGGFVSVGCG